MHTTIKTISSSELEKMLAQQQPEIMYYATAAGVLKIFTVDDFVYRSEFLLEHESEKIKSYIIQHFSVKKILLVGTAFQCSVWRAVFSIPAGKKVSYTDIAHMVNAPRSVRAVANVLGDNKIAYFIPCHRVLRKIGDICGYYWGVEKKEALLKSEGAL